MIYGKYKYFSYNCNNLLCHTELFITVSTRETIYYFPYTGIQSISTVSTNILLALQYSSYPEIFGIYGFKLSPIVAIAFREATAKNAVYMEPQYDIDNWCFAAYGHELNVHNNMFDFL